MAASILSFACGEMTGPLYLLAFDQIMAKECLHVGSFLETTRDLEVLSSLD